MVNGGGDDDSVEEKLADRNLCIVGKKKLSEWRVSPQVHRLQLGTLCWVGFRLRLLSCTQVYCPVIG
jgi:hypothetical protein